MNASAEQPLMTFPKGTLVAFAPGLTEGGGAGRRSKLLIEGLTERGWRMKVVTRAGTLHKFRVTREIGTTIVEVPGWGRPRLGAIAFLACALPLGILWGFRSRAFLAIQLVSQTSAASLCAFVTRRPFVAMTTTTGDLSEVAYVAGRRLSLLRRALIGRARVLVAQTAEGANELRDLVDGVRVEVLPNPVRKVDDASLSGAPNAVFVGRLSAEKDLPCLLESWRVVAESDPAARLTLVGDGGHYRSVEAELRATVAGDPVLARSATFTGYVGDVSPYLRAADVFVLPSKSEGMSNALLEAVAHDRVVVVSDIPANRAVVGEEYPLAFPPGDAPALTEALRLALYDEGVREDARRRNRARVRDHAAETVVERLEGFLIDDTPRSRH